MTRGLPARGGVARGVTILGPCVLLLNCMPLTDLDQAASRSNRVGGTGSAGPGSGGTAAGGTFREGCGGPSQGGFTTAGGASSGAAGHDQGGGEAGAEGGARSEGGG